MWWHRIHDYPRVLYQILQCPFSPTQWRLLSVPLTFGSKILYLYHLQYHKCFTGICMTQAIWCTSCGRTNQHSYIEAYQQLVGPAQSPWYMLVSTNFWRGGALMYVVVYNWHLRGWTWLLCNYLIGPVAWCSFWVCCWLFVTVWFKRMGCWHIFAHSPNTSSTHSFPVNNLWWPYILAYEVSRPNFLDLFLWRHFRQSLLNAICMLWPEHCSSHVPIEGHFPF